MYAWIWRHIPFRQWQLKTLVSVVLVAAVGAVLWYKVFPLVEPILPFYDGQIENSGGQPADGGGPVDGSVPPASAVPGGSESAGGELPGPDVIPYPTVSNNASPRPSLSPRPSPRSSR